MGIQQMSYRDLTTEQRQSGAKKARERIRAAMLNPALTPDQSAYLKAQMVKINRWEACELDSGSEDPPPG